METMLREATPQHTIDSKLSEQVNVVKRDLNDLGRAAGASARRKLGAARDRGGHLVKAARSKSVETVKRRPLGSMAAAVAVGALAGVLLGWK